eukprot:992098-Alexandrium_andersonii.AAC.1
MHRRGWLTGPSPKSSGGRSCTMPREHNGLRLLKFAYNITLLFSHAFGQFQLLHGGLGRAQPMAESACNHLNMPQTGRSNLESVKVRAPPLSNLEPAEARRLRWANAKHAICST